MAFIGNTNTTQAFTPAVDYFSGNGSTTAFTLSRPVASVAQVQVVIDNVAQNPSSAYTVSANTITFTSAPLSGTNNIYVYYTSPITQVIAPGQGTVTATSMASSTGTGAGVFQTSPTITTPVISSLSSASATALTLRSAGTTAITVDTSQNVGIGTASPTSSSVLDVVSGGNTFPRVRSSIGSSAALFFQNSDTGTTTSDGMYVGITGAEEGVIWNNENTDLRIATNNTERMRIDSYGRVSIGASAVLSSEIIYALANTTDFGSRIYNSNSSSPNGLILKYSGASPNNTGNNMLISQDSTATRFYFSSNGGLNNYSANNTNLSDRTVKKDIELAPSYLNKICAIPVKTFLYNDQTDTDLNLGVIAQDVQAVAPELVIESNWGTEEEPVIRLSVYQTDLQYALMKSIQELKAINDTQAETINALTARIEALENR